MNGLFDTHCHLASELYKNEDIELILEEASLVGINLICNVGYDLKTSRLALDQALVMPNIYAAVGIHPNEVNKHTAADWEELEKLVQTGQVYAIGEIGLDYYRNPDQRELQQECFRNQIALAKKYELPILVHIRDAYEDAYEILKEFDVKGIMHCFAGDLETAYKFIELGYYISFSGIVTFQNATMMQKVAQNIPLSKMVLETDAPYLTPHPYRGTKNYPKNLLFTAKKIAELRNTAIEDIIMMTTNNAKKILNIK